MDAKDEKTAGSELVAVDRTQDDREVSHRGSQRSHDADEAIKAFAGVSREDLQIDAFTNKRLQRRIDWNILPIMCIVYGLNYLDKTTLSYASITGLVEDTHLVGDQYQWLGSAFYFGYLAFEYPSTRLLQRLPIGKFSAVMIILWGTVLACLAAVQNFPEALVVRILLGGLESAVTPGFALITSQYYTTEEQALRIGVWFSFNGWAQIFGGFLAYGIARGVDIHGSAIAAWRTIFLATGLFTAAMGVLFLVLVPDSPLSAKFLNPRDRILAVERIRKNNQGVGNKHFKFYQFKEAFTDPVVLLMVFYSLVGSIPNGGISNFFSQLIVSFGFTPEQSLLLGTPGGAVEVVTLLGWGLACAYYPNSRMPISALSLALAILGIVLIVALPLGNNTGRLVGYYLTQASPAPFVALLSLISSNIAGYTKKTTVAAMYLVAYCVGNLIGPQTFRPEDEPRYVPAEITIIVCWGVDMLALGLIYFLCKRRNQKKAAIRAQPGYVKLQDQEFLDLTDLENSEFVYST